jgi:hypothetical protein
MNGTPADTARLSVKKPYTQPKLIKLGTFRDLTTGSVGSLKNDGATRRGIPLKTGRGGRDG